MVFKLPPLKWRPETLVTELIMHVKCLDIERLYTMAIEYLLLHVNSVVRSAGWREVIGSDAPKAICDLVLDISTRLADAHEERSKEPPSKRRRL
jgi:hypothetical protein